MLNGQQQQSTGSGTGSGDGQGNVLNLTWTFGVNRDILGGVHNLSDGTAQRKILFYASSHTGVLYDWVNSRQQLLQGHCNQITTTATTSDSRWILTADTGPNPVLIIWDTLAYQIFHPSTREQTPAERPQTATNSLLGIGAPQLPVLNAVPIKMMFDVHAGTGVVAAEFTADSRYLVTLGNEEEQMLCIWDWTAETEKPLVSIKVDGERQTFLKINPEDPTEILTNGKRSVSFFIWDKESSTLTQHVPLLNSKDFKHAPSELIQSTFIPTTHQSVTSTADGEVIVWTNRSLNNFSQELDKGKKAAIKFMKLHNGGINYITSINKKYMVTGGEDGFVKVFDLQFRLILWFEKLKSGPVSSISFNNVPAGEHEKAEGVVEGYDIPEFIVSTKHSKVVLVTKKAEGKPATSEGTPEQRAKTAASAWATDIKPLIEAQHAPIHGLSTHPTQPYFAVGGSSGLLQVWDYTTKTLLRSRLFEVEAPASDAPKKKDDAPPKIIRITSVTYSTDGSLMALGFANGTLRILNASTLEDHDGPRNPQGIQMEKFYTLVAPYIPVTKVTFSACGQFLAAADGGFGVSLFKKEVRMGQRKEVQGVGEAVERLAQGRGTVEWVQVGRCQAHYKEIISLMFVPADSTTPQQSLISVSSDRHIASYDLEASTISTGLKLHSLKRIDQTARPLAATLLPQKFSLAQVSKDGSVDNPAQSTTVPSLPPWILTSNSEHKLKLFNASTHLCRKTILGPTFGGDITHLHVIPPTPVDLSEPLTEGYLEPKFVAYATENRVVGLMKLPLDGNPHRYTGLIAHPCSISHVCVTQDGSHLLTAGVEDGVVHMWKIQVDVLEAQVALGGKALEPFLGMLEEGVEKEMEDYFYYAQLRSQGEDASTTRQISDTVPINQVPNIMQALGFYPTLQETQDMLNELQLSPLPNGHLQDSITFPDLIRLYINHRPVHGLTESHLLKTLAAALKAEPGALYKPFKSKLDPDEQISKEGLVALLQTYGEPMSKGDLEVAFKALVGDDGKWGGEMPEMLTGREFVESVLGLEAALGPAKSSEGKAAVEVKNVGGMLNCLNLADSRESTPLDI
ncbi:Cilia- and flagella-associated protein 251 [Chytridiales sp. JEL 0842]|nr:Cilia- and flagella-associated protein 251 [Chytridiales sp. JEL 0842]